MVWGFATHQMLRMQWFGHTWLTKRYKYINLKIMAHQKLRTQLCLYTRLTKPYKYNSGRAHGFHNITHTTVWKHGVHQTWQIQRLECSWLTKRYIYNCLVGFLTNPYNTLVWRSMARQTLRIQRFADTWQTKPYKNMCFECFICFLCFPCFACFAWVAGFQCFQVLVMRSWIWITIITATYICIYI